MALTTREKWILAAAPGLLTGFVYFFHTGKPAQLKSTAAIADLEKERAKPFDIRALQSLRDDLDKNEAAIEHAKDDSKLLSGAQAALLGPESEDRSGALHVISKAVEARGMKLSSSERIDVGADAGLPARALAAWKPYAEKTPFARTANLARDRARFVSENAGSLQRSAARRSLRCAAVDFDGASRFGRSARPRTVLDFDGVAMSGATTTPFAHSGANPVLARLNRLFEACAARRASDIHLSPGMPPHLRVDGELLVLPEDVSAQGEPITRTLTGEDTAALARIVLDVYAPSSESLETRMARKGSIDGALSSPDGSRFRFNLFVRQREVGLVFRRLEDRFRSLKELGLPESLYELCDLRDGLVIVCGPTGAGKSTTLAALLDRINNTRSSHVVTIEDPIEYVHKPIKSVISHRQVGVDAPSFNDALVAAMRQDPDVILLGEARDLETMRTSIVAAETGHLVFATLHAGDCIGALERFSGVFPAAEQDGIRRQLALVFARRVRAALVDGDAVDGAERAEEIRTGRGQ